MSDQKPVYSKWQRLEVLEPHYSQHVDAMTREGLESKSDIAIQLAVRDSVLEVAKRQIQELEKEVSFLRSQNDELRAAVERICDIAKGYEKIARETMAKFKAP